MHKTITLFLLFFTRCLIAQTLTGTVVDESELPLPGASVYLDGTSIGSTTDADGKFSLTATSAINTSLIVSMFGYEPIQIANPFANPKYKIKLSPKAEVLKDVVITSDGFSRKDKLKAFEREFLGNNRAGKGCTIKNPDDIELLYNKRTNTLTAKSDKPILIQNDYLGYDISFSLVEFYVSFARYSLDQEQVRKFFYAGTSAYTPRLGKPGRFEKNRSKSFQGSSMHLFRNLCRNEWNRDNFQLFDGSFPTLADNHFSVTKNDQGYEVALLQPSKVKVMGLTKVELPPVHRSYNLLFDKRDQSMVTFQTETFKVDDFGNLDTPYNVMFSGEISKKRVGDLLPLDYREPERE